MYTIWLKPAGGVWEVVGRERYANIWAEDIALESDEHGASTCSFVLKRDVAVSVFPELAAKAECLIEQDSVPVWRGSVWETPSRTGDNLQITVNGKGLQSHLDDAPSEQPAIITNMEGFRDIRQVLSTNLAVYTSEQNVEVSAGSISMGWAQGSTQVANSFAGVVLDLGTPRMIESLALDLSKLNTTILNFYVQLSNQVEAVASGPYYNAVVTTTGAMSTDPATTTFVANIPADQRPYRYVLLKLQGPASTGTPSLDIAVRVRRFQLALRGTDTTLSPGAEKDTTVRATGRRSVLRASDIAAEVAYNGFIDGNPLAQANRSVFGAVRHSSYLEELKSTPDPLAIYFFDGPDRPTVLQDRSGNGNTLVETSDYITPGGAGMLDAEKVTSASGALSGLVAAGSLPNEPNVNRNSAIEILWKSPASVMNVQKTLAYMGHGGAHGWGVCVGSNANSAGSGQYLKVLAGGVAWQTTGFALAANTVYHIVASESANGTMSVYVNNSRVWTGSLAPVSTTAPADITIEPVSGAYTQAIAFYNNEITWPLAGQHYRTALKKNLKSKIRRTHFNIEEYAPQGAVTGRERLEAANAFHDWLWKIDNYGELEFRPRPSTPVLEVGNWSGATFEDSSMNTVEELYNWVRLSGPLAPWNIDNANPNAGIAPGDDFVLERHAGQMLAAGKAPGFAPFVDYSTGVTGPNIFSGNSLQDNPTFASSTTNWSGLYGSTISRVTSVYDSAPASLLVSNSTANVPAAVTVPVHTYGVQRGETMLVSLRMASNVSGAPVFVQLGMRSQYNPQDVTFQYAVLSPKQWTTVTIPFVPDATYTPEDGMVFQATLEIWSHTSNVSFLIDSAKVGVERSTHLDRLGTVRKKEFQTGTMLTIAAMQQVADVALTKGWWAPLKGTINVTKDGGVRTLIGGNEVPVSHLLNYTGEQILLSDQIDPLTGALGRVGTLVGVAVNTKDNSAVLTLDNSRTSFEALLARLALVTGQVTR